MVQHDYTEKWIVLLQTKETIYCIYIYTHCIYMIQVKAISGVLKISVGVSEVTWWQMTSCCHDQRHYGYGQCFSGADHLFHFSLLVSITTTVLMFILCLVYVYTKPRYIFFVGTDIVFFVYIYIYLKNIFNHSLPLLLFTTGHCFILYKYYIL